MKEEKSRALNSNSINAGLFSVPSYTTIGDEFEKPIPISDRSKGSQMTTSPSKRGNGPDVLFDYKVSKEFKSLHLGDKYVDPGAQERKLLAEKAKKKLTPEGFRYSSPPKKSSGLGNYYGCFCDIEDPKAKNKSFRPSHETEYMVIKKGELPDKIHQQPKNIVTRPSKKGTYGVPGTAIGHGFNSYKGDEFKYISDPYEAPKRKEGVKGVSEKPFKTACKRLDYFDGQPNVAASRIYSLDKPLPARKADPPKKDSGVPVPFKPSSPSKGTFGYGEFPVKKGMSERSKLKPFPEYKEDPYEYKERAERDSRAKNKPSVVWKPVSGGKSLAVRSIAFSKSANI